MSKANWCKHSGHACRLAAILAVVAIGLIGCATPAPTGSTLRVLRFGVLPDESRSMLEERYLPLVAYLEHSTGLSCQLVLHGSYEELQAAFEQGEVEVAWLGGYTFVKLNRSHHAVPLVSRDCDLRFTSYYLTGTEETATELEEFRGRRFAFGSRLSTSGHLMPRYFMRESGIDPETFFESVVYTGAHDATANAVRDGDVDLGVANGPIIESMFASNRIGRDEIRVMQETPPYVDYVWACQSRLPAALRTQLRDAFLDLSEADPEHADILNHLLAKYFVPVHSDDFDALRSIVDEIDRSGESR
ncbi:Phosphate-import protein PhnD precursor [Stieleria neptunia]|uniref:Phosphate-import protein PhnD n=1 Tax=Stieleria neptunia TaxID=2527979 RepID=A0A518HSY4_9BACT|nr:phosphate/phosphite/phosphonate ABC transporter substrate-binding protein [Stieleria neptunia]QDV43963.1 Phosphate-import protein PhnD precursor [Stieleria neptunia]